MTNDRHRRGDPALLLDGATQPGGAAVVVAGRLAASVPNRDSRGERGDLFAALRAALATAGLGPKDLASVVVDTGPGSFVGLRVALGLARGLALADRQLAIFGVDAPRLYAVAADARLPVWVALPWGRLRVLLARAEAKGPEAASAALVARSAVHERSELRGKRVVAPRELDDVRWPAGVDRRIPTRSPLEALAELHLAGKTVRLAPDALEPHYLVPPDAVLPAHGTGELSGWREVGLTPTDLDAVMRIENASFAHPWSRDLVREELERRPDRVTFGLRDASGDLAALALARLDVDVMSVLSVAVRPDRRRLGLGRWLVRRLLAAARDGGIARVDLEVRTGNSSAIALYVGEGFVPVGRRKRYYADGADALLMSLALRR